MWPKDTILPPQPNWTLKETGMGIFDLFKKLPKNSLYKDLRQSLCPYCERGLEKVPGAKTRCAKCGKFMYVRTTPKNERVLVTKDGAENIDQQWAELNETEAQPIIEAETVAETKSKLKKQFGREPSSSDVKWRRYNIRLKTLIKKNDIYGLSTTYYEMAQFIEKEGKDPTKYRELGYQMRLRANPPSEILRTMIDSKAVNTVEILAAGDDSCDFCKKLNGTKLNINEALENSPIPASECKHRYGCRCVYLPVVDGL
jgi:hypothetical protein